MADTNLQEERFFHSFPRPRKEESRDVTVARGLKILSFMKHAGLILAPEVVEWNVELLDPKAPPVNLLQCRISFTELSIPELPQHSAMFGPISLAFDIAKLREVGAVPVAYVPQGKKENPVSLIPLFCVNGIHHTEGVLSQLQRLKEESDPSRIEAQHKMPVSPTCEINLRNTGTIGEVVHDYKLKLRDAQNVLKWIGFNNIPFDFSAAVLRYYMSLFYPTDNLHNDDQLGYYRQREWRLIGSDIGINGRSTSRMLCDSEIAELHKIDPQFWSRELNAQPAPQSRSRLARIYEPTANWNFFDLVSDVFAPESVIEDVRSIVGGTIPVRPIAETESDGPA